MEEVRTPRLLTARFWRHSDLRPAEGDRHETDDWRFVSDQDDATAIEYAQNTSLTVVCLIGAPSALGANLNGEFAEVCAALK